MRESGGAVFSPELLLMAWVYDRMAGWTRAGQIPI